MIFVISFMNSFENPAIFISWTSSTIKGLYRDEMFKSIFKSYKHVKKY